MRYVNLSIILVFRLVSKKVMDRFPDYESLVEAKLMLPSEVKRLEKTDERTPHESTWAPISWAMKLITLGKRIKKPHHFCNGAPLLHVSSKIFEGLFAFFILIDKTDFEIYQQRRIL